MTKSDHVVSVVDFFLISLLQKLNRENKRKMILTLYCVFVCYCPQPTNSPRGVNLLGVQSFFFSKNSYLMKLTDWRFYPNLAVEPINSCLSQDHYCQQKPKQPHLGFELKLPVLLWMNNKLNILQVRIWYIVFGNWKKNKINSNDPKK